VSEKPIEEEEEQQEHKNSGRSAYFAGIHAAQDGYSGSYRGVKAAPHGGAATVKEEDTLGSATYCWCGDTFDHDWPGKDKGRRHPRKESSTVSAQQHHEEHFDSTQLKTFDRRVTRFITDLANDYGVRVRVLDGSHVILYGLDGEGSLKVSASRQAEQSLGYLEKFTREHVAPSLTTVKAEALAEHFNDPTKKRRTRATKKAAAPTPAPALEVAPDPVPAPPAKVERTEDRTVRDLNPDAVPPKGYEQHFGQDGTPLNWWKKIGVREWLCKSCDFTASGSLHGAGAHTGLHTLTPEQRAANSSLAGRSRDDVMAGKRTKARNAIRFLASEYGIELAEGRAARSDSKKDEKIARLTRQLDKVTAERDDLQARLDLIREGLRA